MYLMRKSNVGVYVSIYGLSKSMQQNLVGVPLVFSELANQGRSRRDTEMSGMLNNEILNALANKRLGTGFFPKRVTNHDYQVKMEYLTDAELPNFNEIQLTKEVPDEPSDDLLNKQLKSIFFKTSKYEESDGPAAEGYRVTFDSYGYLEGEEALRKDLFHENQTITLGQGVFVDGFEEGLVGTVTGQESEFTFTYPENYFVESLMRKTAVVTVTIKAIEKPVHDKPDKEWAKQFEAENVDEIRERLLLALKGDLKRASEQRLKRHLFDELVKYCNFEVPEKLIDKEFETIWSAQMADLGRKELPITVLGESVEEVEEEYWQLAKRRVLLGQLIGVIGEKKGILVTDDDLDNEVRSLASKQPGYSGEVRRYYRTPKRRRELVGPIIENKVAAWILSQCKLDNINVDPEDLLTELGD